ncbi:Rieske (2Fe-2S) protein [Streptantibioticus ferralitis]|uniref:Cytochrome bc1 complex Rieske iron-sulfur subunit n=1 Tax=Streptantibioticus ferralitis TaxID=236510 RepID=A0ABT5Z8K7_9ACTN|nr:Rieske (2Fe-2S) protein [Streptantibioticus ferralitis]MDF2260163.1 Rieske (2Fe-2S) protein [Streptantibioticus ferralitis]
MDDLTSGSPVSTSRRTVVAAAGAVGLAAALAACSGSNSNSAASAPSQDSSSQASGSSPESSSSAPAGNGGSGGGGGAVLAKTSDIPQGGGKVFPDKQVVVTQPTAGTFKAFSTICTHQGCPVNQVQNGTINCPCHGSKFHIADGSVANGPATQPLAPAKISVEGGSVKLV